MDDEEMQRLERCALGGFSLAAEARVLALHRVGKFAGVWVRTNDESGRGDEIVIAEHHDGSWSEMSSGSAAWTWSAFRDEHASDESGEELGVLAVLGELAEPGIVRAQCRDTSIAIPSTGRHWVVLFVGVDPEAMNDVRITSEPADARGR